MRAFGGVVAAGAAVPRVIAAIESSGSIPNDGKTKSQNPSELASSKYRKCNFVILSYRPRQNN